MAKRPFFRRLPRLMAAGLFLCMLPTFIFALSPEEESLTPAVAAVSPAAPEGDPAQSYRALSLRLSGLGLDPAQIRTLWGRMGAALGERLDAGTLSRDDLDYLALPYGREALLARYQAYTLAHPELSVEDVAIWVNMGLDGDFYADIQTVDDPASTGVLVNKYNALPADYVPELVPLTGLGGGSLTATAAEAFSAMAEKAREDGISLRSVSAYRSYSTQAGLYRRYVSQSGRQLSDTFSARAGHSEHQTGLALDINVASTSAHFENTPAYAWLVEHCADYGFILRYPQGKEYITGYRFEPWHYRYVGAEAARACMDQGLAYEEYMARQPVAGENQAPALFYHGQALEVPALVLQGVPCLSAADLALALGWTATQDGTALTMTDGDRRLTIVSGCRCQVNGVTLRLTSPALELDGALYLPLDDLCAAMGLHAQQEQAGLSLVQKESHPQPVLV